MSKTHYGICNFCDSICGLEIEHEGNEIIAVRGDKQDPFSRGHVCPKGIAQQDLYNDPDRIKRPVMKKNGQWEEVSWEEAYRLAGSRLAHIQAEYGNDAVALYYGNPIAHNYGSLLALVPFVKGFKSKNIYSATSVDSLTRMLISLLLYGNQAILPIPDITRTEYMLIIGANPVVSNGSIMTAGDCKKRLAEIRERGGRIVVVDPRRTETADIADAHYFIRPGADAFFLLALLDVLFKEGLAGPGPMVKGLDRLESIADKFPPERVAEAVGIPSATIREIALEFAKSPKAVCYGRMGTSTQIFGSLATWLVDALNIVTGNIDRPGGVMFTTPAVDLVGLARLLRQPGFFNRWQSRVSGLPEFNGEFPVAALAEEMETPGPGQIRALVTNSGNPVLSLPNGRRLERAFGNLEFMVSIDFYINETTRLADLILPPVCPMETDHYSILEHAMGVLNAAHYAPALFEKPEGSKHNWEIQLDLVYHLEKGRGPVSAVLGAIKRRALDLFGPHTQLDLLLRFGPHKLSIEKLLEHPHGLDLGPLEPRLEKIISTRDRLIDLAPEVLTADVARLEQKLSQGTARKPGEFLLVSRRTLRSINTWMHNSPRLVKGPNRCVLMMNPEDAETCGLEDGQDVSVRSRVGEIIAPLQVTDEMMPGVVSLTFGWGHHRPGARLSVATEHAGVSMNDVLDDSLYDAVSGISVLDGIEVMISDASRRGP